MQEIANDYRKITYSSLQRHNQNCLQAGAQAQDEAQDDEAQDVELEDLRNKALEHYEYAIDSGNTKLADSALSHLIRIEELIARRDDRATQSGDNVVEIEIKWSDEEGDLIEEGDYRPCHERCPYIANGLLIRRCAIPGIPAEPEPVEPEPDIDNWQALAEASKPTHLIKTDSGEILGVETPTGDILKDDIRELPVDEYDREEKGIKRRFLRKDGTIIEDIAAFKPSTYIN